MIDQEGGRWREGARLASRMITVIPLQCKSNPGGHNREITPLIDHIIMLIGHASKQ